MEAIKNDAIAVQKTKPESEKDIPLFDEVLIQQELYDSNIATILELETKVQEKRKALDLKKTKLLRLQDAEREELEKYYEDIQKQLKETLIVLTDARYRLQIEIEKTQFDEMERLCKERDANFADFAVEYRKEDDYFKKLCECRAEKIKDYDLKVSVAKEKMEESNEKIQSKRLRSEDRVKELEFMVQKERDVRQELMKENEEFYKKVEENSRKMSEEKYSNFAAELEMVRKENQFKTSELARLKAEFNYEKECGRVLDAEVGKKKRMSANLKKIRMHVMHRINQMNKDIQRKEAVLDDKVAMIKILEADSVEMKHMSSEADWRQEECRKILREKSEGLSKLSTEREQLENIQSQLMQKLKNLKREHFVEDEKLKSNEKSIADSTRKLLEAQLTFERWRQEFIDSTKDIETSFMLRSELLKLYDKRALRTHVKEDKFDGEIDPYIKFCRQRDDYEAVINTVLSRKEEIQASYRSACVNLAKENSDWTAFAESLRRDIKQKQEQIRILEKCLKLSAKDFSKDPKETQKRFIDVCERLTIREEAEDEEIKKRMDLIEKQTSELHRLHGLIVVGERGKIVKKIRRL